MKSKHTPVKDLISRTTSATFQAYSKELRRHENALRSIYGKDKLHKHVPEEVGSINQVWPEKRHVVTYYRCAICMKDLTLAEARKLRRIYD